MILCPSCSEVPVADASLNARCRCGCLDYRDFDGTYTFRTVPGRYIVFYTSPRYGYSLEASTGSGTSYPVHDGDVFDVIQDITISGILAGVLES